MELLDFIKSHENWEELLTAEPYNLKISRDAGYIIFKYNQISSDFTLNLVRECRGLIIRELDMTVVCYPFYKFGNYGESYCPDIDWSTSSVQEKIDGSLMKVWFDDGWHISTNGTIDAFKAELASMFHDTYGALFLDAVRNGIGDEHKFFGLLDPKFTYMFELVGPENRVVIPYEKNEIYFLGARYMDSFYEQIPEAACFDELRKYFKIPKRFELKTFNDVKAAADAMSWDTEGFVVCDAQFNRVKIKSPEYVKAHFCRQNNIITQEHLLEVILSGERAEFLTYAGDFKDELDKVEKAYSNIRIRITVECDLLHLASFASRKDLAMYVKTKPVWLQGFLFAYDRLPEFIAKIKPNKWIEFMKAGGYLE